MLSGREHLLQRRGGDPVVRGVPDRLPANETDHLRRLVHHPGAIRDDQRERAILSDQHLDATRTAVPFSKPLELGPSSG